MIERPADVPVKAPRDVIERATQLWVPTTADNFPASSTIAGSTLTTPTGTWAITAGAGATVVVGPSGGVVLTAPALAGSQALITTPAVTVAATGAWRCIVSLQSTNAAGLTNVTLDVGEASDTYTIEFARGTAVFVGFGLQTLGTVALPTGPSCALMLESDGEWVWAFVNGELVGCVRRGHATTTTLATTLVVNGALGHAVAATFTGVLTEALQPFLQRGSSDGDYVLPR